MKKPRRHRFQLSQLLFLIVLCTPAVSSQSIDTTYLQWFSESILYNPEFPGIIASPQAVRFMYNTSVAHSMNLAPLPSSVTEWESIRQSLLDTLKKVYGIEKYLSQNHPANITYNDTVQFTGYKLITLTFMTFPGIKLAGSLYLPDSLSSKAPAVLYAEGHYEPNYGTAHWQAISSHLAKQGYIVLGISLLGRMASWWNPDFNYDKPFGYLLNFLDQSYRLHLWIAPYLRGLDLLSARNDVDTSRIAVTGFSNGGVVAYHMAALDERVKAAVVVTAMPAYQHAIYQIGSTSAWGVSELSVYDEMALSKLAAPKPVLYILDLNDTFFPPATITSLQEQLESLYVLYGHPERLHFSLTQTGHNYDLEKRELMYSWFDYWLKGDSTVGPGWRTPELSDSVTYSFFLVPGVNAFSDFDVSTKPVESFIDSIAQADYPTFERPTDALTASQFIQDAKIKLTAFFRLDEEPVPVTLTKVGERSDSQFVAEYFHFKVDDGLYLPVVIEYRKHFDPRKVLLTLLDRPRARGQWRYDERIKEWLGGFLDKGYMIVGIDLLGIGETEFLGYNNEVPEGEINWDRKTYIETTEALFGRSEIGRNAKFVTGLMDALEQKTENADIQLYTEGAMGTFVGMLVSMMSDKIVAHIAGSAYPSFKTALDNRSFGRNFQIYTNKLYPLIDYPQALSISAMKPLLIGTASNYDESAADATRFAESIIWCQSIDSLLGGKSFAFLDGANQDALAFRNVHDWILRHDRINEPPHIVSTAKTIAKEDSLFTYDVIAVDPDSSEFPGSVKYRFAIKPSWLEIDSLTGTVRGTPIWIQARDTVVAIEAWDDGGGVARQEFLLNVIHVNHQPMLAVIADTTAREDSLYFLKLEATDQDTIFGDVIRYRIMSGPVWLGIDSVVGILSGIPAATDVGYAPVAVQADDGAGGTISRFFVLNVIHTNHAPTFNSVPKTFVWEDSTYSYEVKVSDADTLFNDTLLLDVIAIPNWLSFNSLSATLSGVPRDVDVGSSYVVLHARDDSGAIVEQRFPLQVRHVNHGPVIESAAPDSGTFGNLYWYQVVATDQDTLFNDRLKYRIAAGPEWLKIESTRGIVAGVAPIEGDNHALVEIEVEDEAGAIASQSFEIILASQQVQSVNFQWIVPVDSLTVPLRIPREPLQFVWSRNPNSVGQYSELRIQGPGVDTIISGIGDTTTSLAIMERLQPNAKYLWLLKSVDANGPVKVDSFYFRTSAIKFGNAYLLSSIPASFLLEQNFPNPFNPGTTIVYGLPEGAEVRLEIFNLVGQLVFRRDERQEPGYYDVYWDGNDLSGRRVSSGVYIYRLTASGVNAQRNSFIQTKKMLLLK